jgi:AcrR family transcriptional regulator
MVVSMRRRTAATVASSPQSAPRAEALQAQRERLIAAMAEVVAAVGYEEASVERVLVQAGMSRRTFYELFRDKEDCYLAVYEHTMRRVLRTVAEAYLECEQPARRIEAALEAFLRFCAEEPRLARACVVEVFAAGPRARELRAEAMERLAAMMEHALGQLRDDDRLDRLSARALVGAVHELIYLPVDRLETEELPELAGEIVATQVAPLVGAVR